LTVFISARAASGNRKMASHQKPGLLAVVATSADNANTPTHLNHSEQVKFRIFAEQVKYFGL